MNKLLNLLKENIDSIVKPVVVLLAICIIIPLALSFTNKITVNRIAELEVKNQNEAMSRLIEAEDFKKKSLEMVDVAEPFDYYVAENGGVVAGYIFVTSSKGYGGDVSVMTAINTDGTVKSVAILDAANETPGLGQNVTKEAFYSQFEGKKFDVKVKKNGAVSENNEINAVTGATISSTAVTNAVNQALDNYKAVLVDIGNFDSQEVAVDEK